MVVAMAIVLVITAGVFSAVRVAPDATLAQTEMSDLQQRARVAVDALLRELTSASAVVPYRWGGASEDPPGSFKTDTITAITATRPTTYWLKSDALAGAYQLMSWSGGTSADVPVVDNVVAFSVAYTGDGAQPLTAAELTDGPWTPSAAAPNRRDTDLNRVREVAIMLRVQAASARVRGPSGEWFARAGTARRATQWVPDFVAHFRVAPRNLNLGR